jgi:hypothetical protein
MARKNEVDVSDPLASAIDELREELLLWIDTELTRVKEHLYAQVAEEELATLPALQRAASASIRGPSNDGLRTRTRLGHRADPSRQSDVDHEPAANLDWPAVAPQEELTDPGPQLPAASPRERLDALARMLDRRLKLAADTEETERRASVRSDRNLDAVTPGPSGREDRS